MILAGCGSSGAPSSGGGWQTVRGSSFRFEVPSSWRVEGARASRGGDLVRVATFPLVRPYTPVLFEKVAGELAARMAEVAARVGGEVTGHRVVEVAGAKAHSYTVAVGGRTDAYTFVLRGGREYQLLCSAREPVCARLLTSFAAS